ncbi:MAG: TcpQ domain-containing protein [Alphaproteobacteria bacterium]
MTRKRFTRLALILSSAAILSWPVAAQAGFEWKGPIEAPAQQPAAMSEMGGMSDLAPVTSDAPPAAQMSAPMPVESTAVAAMPAGEVLSGFAKDVPLVMALQQIVPPGYQYSFSSGVDAGTSVSWEGGKPWQGVLSDMLAAHGLGYSIQSNTIVVGAAQNNMPAPAPMPAQQDSMMMPMPGETASSSSQPLNIVSQPPGSPEPVTTAPATANNMGAASVAAKKEDEVTIRRDKPKSLLERLGFVRRKEADVPAAHEAPRQVAAANVPAPMPAAAPVTVTDAPVATQSVAAVTAVPAASAWQGMKGQTLRDVLKAWSDKSGVDLYWSIDYDYRLSEDVGLAGSYEEAVGGLLDKFASVRPQPYGQLHQGNQGPRVLVIKSYDLAQ